MPYANHALENENGAAARFTYDVVDQKGVDGLVNGIGVSASETGGLLRLLQSGRVQQYALVAFAALGAGLHWGAVLMRA